MRRALPLLVLLVSCRVDPLLGEGRPCTQSGECGPGLTCDPLRHECVRGWNPIVDARLPDGKTASDTPAATRQVDLLFVIDNSKSMDLYQPRLVSAIPGLLDGLRSSLPAGPLLDLRIGVVSTDLGTGQYAVATCTEHGDGGKLQATARIAGCTPPADAWLAISDGTINVPGSGDLLGRAREAFACIATLGTSGCGLEQPLEAARVALDPARGVNPGFRRSGALLVIVILSDEDDCSAAKPELFDVANTSLSWLNFRCTECGLVCDQSALTSAGTKTHCVPGQSWLVGVTEYASFFKALAPGRVLLAALAGPVSSTIEVEVPTKDPMLKGSCSAAQPSGMPAIRIAAVVSEMGAAGLVNPAGTDICSSDYGPALKALAGRIRSALGL
jgi:hypothetical protein